MPADSALDVVHASWRDVYPVHPCADVFPMLGDAEIDELANDIKDNGLREPVVLWMNPIDQQLYVVDGRNRLDALERLGVTFSRMILEAVLPDGQTQEIFKCSDTSDPAAYVISANIHRRHLTKEQQAELIVRTIEASRNDDANLARSFSPIPGKRGGSSKDQVFQKAVEVGKRLGISPRTIQRGGAKVRGVPKSRRKKPTAGSATRAATSDASAVETSAPAPSTTAAAVAKKIGTILQEVGSAIHQAVTRWPPGTSLEQLIVWLGVQADRLHQRDKVGLS